MDQEGPAPESEDERVPTGRLETRIVQLLLPEFVSRRLAAKFVVTLLLLVVTVGLVGGYTVVQVETIIQDDAEATLRSTASIQADNVAEWMAGMRTQTRALSTADAYARADLNPLVVSSMFASVAETTSSEVVAIHYVDASGDVVASTNERRVGERPRAISPGVTNPVAEAFEAEAGTITTSDAAFEDRGQLLVAFASQVRTGDGVVVVVGDVGADFQQLHRQRDVVTTRVLNDEGKGVLSPRRNNPSEVAGTAQFQAALNGSTELIEGDTQVLALAPVPGTDWVVRTAAPTDELYRASETVGRNVLVMVAVTLALIVLIAVVLGRQTVQPLVDLRRRADAMEGGDLSVDLQSPRRDEIGQLYASFSSMRDALREQIREAEAARQAAERSQAELERKNERLDTFASTVSHDLRNPLAVAQGNRQLLADRLEDTSELDAIRSAHERMSAIIDDVLALARSDSTVETESLSLEELAENAWASVETGTATLRIDDSRPIEADRTRLQRVFENLFRNAVEHGSTNPHSSSTREDVVEHGETDVTVTVGLLADGEGFFVADDGPGIPPEHQETVFEYGHTTEDDGTGLGLAIVSDIAEAHGWTVEVDNDDGARFVFRGGFDTDSN